MALPPSAHLHLEWIKHNPSFVPEIPIRTEFKTYFDDMQNFWYFHVKMQTPIESITMMADHWLRADMKLLQSYETRILEVKRLNGIGVRNYYYFVTLNFSNQLWSIPKCLKVMNNVLKASWVLTCLGNFEYHVETGLHPHMHLLLSTPPLLSPTKKSTTKNLVKFLFKLSGMQSVLTAEHFIEVDSDPKIEEHRKYILGDKRESKLSYVAKDILWRRENSIPEFFEK